MRSFVILNITNGISPHAMSSQHPKPPKPKRRLVTLWIPTTHVDVIDKVAASQDSDRSKWIREAIREKAGIRATG